MRFAEGGCISVHLVVLDVAAGGLRRRPEKLEVQVPQRTCSDTTSEDNMRKGTYMSVLRPP